MIDWQKKELGNLLQEIRNGCAAPQVPEVTDFPVTRIETIADATINHSKIGYVTKIDNRYKLREGDLLLSNINSLKHIGKVAFYDGRKPLYHGMNLLLLRFVEECDPKFFFYYLTLNKGWFEMMAAQAINQASINQSTIKSFEVFIPKYKEEQIQIAAVLSCIDRAIKHTGALIAKQQRIKTGLMQDLLTKGIDEHGNIRSEATHEFKDSSLGRIPKE
jgi:type I restriction enzyme S subunit